MTNAVIVSTARTPIGKAYRGAFNATTPQALSAHAISHAVERAGVDPAEINDCIMGAALQQGHQGGQYCEAGCYSRGTACNGGRHVVGSSMCKRHDGNSHCGHKS